MRELITLLQSHLDKLPARDQVFASDLIASFRKYGRLSPKQAPWIEKLIERATGPSAPPPVNLGTFANVAALFAKAKTHLKWPKITLDCAGVKIVLSVAGPASRFPGSINVAGEGSFGNRPWFGRISPSGEWTPSASDSVTLARLQQLLTEFGTDPAGVAQKYGKLTGNCCFCSDALTDARSRAAGFGPVCADHYGLKEQWKSAAKNARDDEAVMNALVAEGERAEDRRAADSQLALDSILEVA